MHQKYLSLNVPIGRDSNDDVDDNEIDNLDFSAFSINWWETFV